MSDKRTGDLLEELVDSKEELTDGFPVINTDHALTHAGYGLVFTIFDAQMTTGQVVDYSFIAPPTLFAHIKNLAIISLGGSVKVEIFSGATYTSNNGTVIPITNTNDNSAVVATSILKSGVVIATTGTSWATAYALADATNQSVGIGTFVQNANQELVTESASKQYLIRVTNLNSATIGPVVINGFFYEETKGITT